VAAPFFTEDYTGGVQNSTSRLTWGSINSARKAIIADPDDPSAYCFRIRGRPAGSDAFDNQAFIEHRFALDRKYSEIWIEYGFRLSANWQHRTPPSGSSNGKFFLLWEDVYSQNLLVGTEYLLSTVTNIGGSAIRGYSVLPDIGLIDFESARAPFLGGPNGAVTLNTWHRMRFYVRVSTYRGNADGIYKVWVDDTLVYNQVNVVIDRRVDSGVRPGINYGYFLGSANQGFVEDTDHLFRKWKFHSTNPGW
jgi:hypothetical protein